MPSAVTRLQGDGHSFLLTALASFVSALSVCVCSLICQCAKMGSHHAEICSIVWARADQSRMKYPYICWDVDGGAQKAIICQSLKRYLRLHANRSCVVKKSGFAMKERMTHGIVVALARV